MTVGNAGCNGQIQRVFSRFSHGQIQVVWASCTISCNYSRTNSCDGSQKMQLWSSHRHQKTNRVRQGFVMCVLVRQDMCLATESWSCLYAGDQRVVYMQVTRAIVKFVIFNTTCLKFGSPSPVLVVLELWGEMGSNCALESLVAAMVSSSWTFLYVSMFNQNRLNIS